MATNWVRTPTGPPAGSFPGLAACSGPVSTCLPCAVENGAGTERSQPRGACVGTGDPVRDGTTTSVRSDGTWKCSRQGGAGWQERSSTTAAGARRPSWLGSARDRGAARSRRQRVRGALHRRHPGRAPDHLCPATPARQDPEPRHGPWLHRQLLQSCHGRAERTGPVRTDATGSWTAIPPPGTRTDWVLVLKR